MTSEWEQSACPEEAARDYESFCHAYAEILSQPWPRTPKSRVLMRIFGNSLFLSQHLIRAPRVAAEFLDLADWEKEKSENEHRVAVRNLAARYPTSFSLLAALKRYKYAEYTRLTLRELSLLDQTATYREFSVLARVMTEAVIGAARRELAERLGVNEGDAGDFALIAMGKLGGDELNYSSDIDLIGLYDTDGDLGGITRHEFYAKLFADVGNKLGSYDENGFLYRVDWDLRPEGPTGTLANSLDAMESYYETFGAEWERQAFIKADVLCDRGGLGAKFLDMMTPFVYRKYFDAGTIERIRDMKSRLIVELDKKRVDGVNIKLGHGGIRDVEFVVQGLQLLHAGKTPELRRKNTLEALSALTNAGLIDGESARLIRDGYLFLRRVESAIQMESERQTHVLKNGFKNRLKIARRLGLSGSPQHAVDEFNEALEKAMGLIHREFQKLYG